MKIKTDFRGDYGRDVTLRERKKKEKKKKEGREVIAVITFIECGNKNTTKC